MLDAHFQEPRARLHTNSVREKIDEIFIIKSFHAKINRNEENEKTIVFEHEMCISEQNWETALGFASVFANTNTKQW